MNKEQFCQIMEMCKQALDTGNVLFVNQLFSSIKDPYGDIQDFVFRLKCGDAYFSGCTLDEDMSPLDFSTPEKLYDYLASKGAV